MKKMRPLRTGGYSMCSCPDELVGKGRCKHVLGIAQVIYDDRDSKIKMVNMDGLNVSDNSSKDIKDMLGKIPQLPDDTVNKLLEFFKSFKM